MGLSTFFLPYDEMKEKKHILQNGISDFKNPIIQNAQIVEYCQKQFLGDVDECGRLWKVIHI